MVRLVAVLATVLIGTMLAALPARAADAQEPTEGALDGIASLSFAGEDVDQLLRLGEPVHDSGVNAGVDRCAGQDETRRHVRLAIFLH